MKKTIIILTLLLISGCTYFIDCDGTDCYQTAISENDEKYCTKLDGSLRDACYLEISKVNSNIVLCEDIKDITTRNQCKYEIALKEDNVLICDNILEIKFKDKCYYEIYKEKDDFSKCSLITDTTFRSDCQYNVAINTEFMNCNNVLDQAEQNNCFFHYAFAEKNPRYCRMAFGDVISKMSCLNKVARMNEDQSICDEIVIQSINESCQNMFEDGQLKEIEFKLRDKDLAKYS